MRRRSATRIAKEREAKNVNPNAVVKTLHGVGFGLVQRNWQGVRSDNTRGVRLARQASGGDEAPDAMVTLVARLAGLGKEMKPFVANPSELIDIAEEYDCQPDEDWEEDGWTTERVAACAYRAMGMATRRDVHNSIDFADMLFLPLRHGWARGRYELVVVDEAQDMNAAQLELALRACTAGGRVLVVGDDRQAIYGFRGADSGSIDRLKLLMNAPSTKLGDRQLAPALSSDALAPLLPQRPIHIASHGQVASQ